MVGQSQWLSVVSGEVEYCPIPSGEVSGFQAPEEVMSTLGSEGGVS